MSGRVALSNEASLPRLLVVDGDAAHDVFDVLASSEAAIRARSALLFEVGEELQVRIEQDGSVWRATAKVIAHLGTGAERVTQLEISDRYPMERGAEGAGGAEVD
jgi:hypothetical protein